MKKITILGGGTGSYLVISALKKHQVDLSAVVTMMDSGGSTGRLRDQLGVLPPGDLRQCLVALSDAPELWRKLFSYRFENGDFAGHSFGNIMISALEKVSKNYDEVLDELHYLMKCVGRVYPAALTNANIKVTYNTGRTVDSETLLDDPSPDGGNIVKAEAIPPTIANSASIKAIASADYIIAGPGDLYSSIISISLMEGVREAVKHSPAKFIYILNLMTKSSQTLNYAATDHIRDMTTYFGRQPDICIVNSEPFDPEMLKQYVSHDESPVVNDLTLDSYSGKIITAPLLDTSAYVSSSQVLASKYAHSIIRHDVNKLEAVLSDILF